MEPTTTPAAAPAAPINEPAPVPAAPPPTPAPAPAPASQSFGEGGFLGGMTLMGVGMCALAGLAFFYAIYHYRLAIKTLKTSTPQDRKDIDEIKGNLKAMMGPDYKSY